MLNIDKTVKDGKAVISFGGRLDTTTSPEADAAIKEVIDGLTELVFDFEKLDYISSAGLRILLSAQKKMNAQGSMIVTNVSDTIKEIFEVTGFSDILTIQ